jgi:hypothetical protein
VLFHEVPALVGDARGGAEARRLAEDEVRVFLEQRQGELDVLDLGRAAFTVVQAVNALAHESMVSPRDDLGDVALVDEATALVVRYLRPRSSPREL